MTVVRLTIFHTSDEHGRIENSARIAHIVKDEEAKNPGGVMLVSSGDFFQGSAVSDLLGPEPSQRLVGASGYRFLALGNHDFDRGQEFTQQWIKNSKATVLAANVIDGTTGQLLPGTRPYDVAELKGVKLGFFGLTTPETASMAFPGMLGTIQFTDPVAAGRQAVDALHQAGAKIAFNLSHLGDGDADFARQVPGVQILGGHTHIAWDKPQVVNGDPIYHPGTFRASLTRLDLDVDAETGEIVNVQSKLITLKPEDAEDAAVAALVNGYLAQMQSRTQQVVGHLDRPLQHVDRGANDMDPVLTQNMLDKTGADVAFVNRQFVRQGLAAGDVTQGQILDAMPFTNQLQVAEVSAADVATALSLSEKRNDETSLSVGSHNNRYTLKAGSLFDTKANQPVPPHQRLKVASTDYILAGGLSYFTPPTTIQPPVGPLRDVFVEALAQ